MNRLLPALLIVVASACASAADPESEVRRYYKRVDVVALDDLPRFRPDAERLLPLGEGAIKELARDIAATEGTSSDTRIKAMFAVAVFVEEGRAECMGLVIPILIKNLADADERIRDWSLLLLESVTQESPGELQKHWQNWWETDGAKKFAGTCGGWEDQ